ncbi:hypothetical protein HMPREF1549_01939 [Actinomyces johnsonii F0510]|uniref:Uncharacterized protein n=1 Tax=Actinomyces johnsonii F0510 TaxID=1227262 RepID=U1Q815_9ACTO|nr:hypothetical protein HMPREF1549_01939 [Actinomyces johnsonii F0510]
MAARRRSRCAATRQRVEQKRVSARFEPLIWRPHPGLLHVLIDSSVTDNSLE